MIHPSRVMVILPEHWPRSILRAALRELGYDAIGARSVGEALAYPPREPGRGPVRVLVLDAAAEGSADVRMLSALRSAHGDPASILLTHMGGPEPPSAWDRVLRRPVSVSDIGAEVQRLLPLRPEAVRPFED